MGLHGNQSQQHSQRQKIKAQISFCDSISTKETKALAFNCKHKNSTYQETSNQYLSGGMSFDDDLGL